MCLLWVDTEVTWFCFYSNCIKSITCIRKLQLASTQNIENIEKKIFFMNDEKVFWKNILSLTLLSFELELELELLLQACRLQYCRANMLTAFLAAVSLTITLLSALLFVAFVGWLPFSAPFSNCLPFETNAIFYHRNICLTLSIAHQSVNELYFPAEDER